MVALAVVLSCLAACHAAKAGDTNATPRTPPPALAEPLLLLDDAPATNSPAAKMADNTRCQVCHLNLALEEMTLTHARAEIGCAKCHGASDRHIADESWASGGNGTPPETMYPRYRINGFCRDCHNGPNETRKSGPPCPKLAGAWTAKKFCTECHGHHRLPERKCKWK